VENDFIYLARRLFLVVQQPATPHDDKSMAFFFSKSVSNQAASSRQTQSQIENIFTETFPYKTHKWKSVTCII